MKNTQLISPVLINKRRWQVEGIDLTGSRLSFVIDAADYFKAWDKLVRSCGGRIKIQSIVMIESNS